MDLDDAVFHYTSAKGLLGILSSGQLWSTAHIATNDESEFRYGQGVLASVLEASGAVGQMDARVLAALEKLGMNHAEAAARFRGPSRFRHGSLRNRVRDVVLQSALRKGLSRRPAEPVAGVRRRGRIRHRVQ